MISTQTRLEKHEWFYTTLNGLSFVNKEPFFIRFIRALFQRLHKSQPSYQEDPFENL